MLDCALLALRGSTLRGVKLTPASDPTLDSSAGVDEKDTTRCAAAAVRRGGCDRVGVSWHAPGICSTYLLMPPTLAHMTHAHMRTLARTRVVCVGTVEACVSVCALCTGLHSSAGVGL